MVSYTAQMMCIQNRGSECGSFGACAFGGNRCWGDLTLADADRCVKPMQGMGYEYVPEFEADVPERRYFRKGSSGVRIHQAQMVETTSEWWERHLLFRDYIRAHSDTAREYLALKRRLAAASGDDVEA